MSKWKQDNDAQTPFAAGAMMGTDHAKDRTRPHVTLRLKSGQSPGQAKLKHFGFNLGHTRQP